MTDRSDREETREETRQETREEDGEDRPDVENQPDSYASVAAMANIDERVDLLEPHESIKYVGKLFKGLGVAIFLLMLAEIVIGVSQDGIQAIPILLLEVSQLLVFAGLLWGFGDLTYLIVETNHDVRASRVHLWQLNMMKKMEMSQMGTEVEPVDPDNPLF